jgi:transcriptional regulator with XRE-family HTH domain
MTDRLKQTIGARVKSARRRAGMSQEQVAAKIRRTPESISNIERGQQLPGIDTLVDLATVLNIPVMELLKTSGEQRRVSAERAENEARILDMVSTFSDRAVAIAAEQLGALHRVK